MAPEDPIFRITCLRKYFTENDSLLDRLNPAIEPNHIRAVDGVDLIIKQGETVGVVGESGCGKSTLARAALRLIEPTDGDVWYKGRNVTDFDSAELRSFRSEVQMIFQDPYASLNPRYTVGRALREPMRVHGIGDSREDREDRVEDLLERVGLNAGQVDRFPHEFSGGQRQRVALARALAVEPSLLVADEPLSALDVSVQARILALLNDLQAEMGLTILFISHDLSIVRRISDRFAVMYLGKIVESGVTNNLFDAPKHPYTEALLSSIPVPDPSYESDRIILQGDVPKPDDPPNGCHFHPRCPKVIPPETWPDDQTAFRQYVQLRNRVENGEIDPQATRKKLATNREGRVSDDTVIDDLFEEHVIGPETLLDADHSLTAAVRKVVIEALELVQDGESERAVSVLDEAYKTVCEAREPMIKETDQDWEVSCHLHDETVDQPSKTIESSVEESG